VYDSATGMIMYYKRHRDNHDRQRIKQENRQELRSSQTINITPPLMAALAATDEQRR
jgi:hypothetical protein